MYERCDPVIVFSQISCKSDEFLVFIFSEANHGSTSIKVEMTPRAGGTTGSEKTAASATGSQKDSKESKATKPAPTTKGAPKVIRIINFTFTCHCI